MNARNFWQGLGRAARWSLAAGLLAIVLLTSGAAWWLLRTDYQALFTQLKAPDAQAMTAELEKLKIPYRLGNDGTSILVDKATLHATRIKLMGRDLPLHGAVGLELFNNTDFGMTEFAQKINYQRALQGELTRTIQSLSQVSEARVLLALPEQGLFKQASSGPKASITMALHPGQALRPEQVKGIQRLVAAAVPGMAVQDVTLVDSQGLALTRAGPAAGGAALDGDRLDLQRDIEAYLARKASAVLDSALGAGRSLASVDATLDMDQIRTTTEDVVPAASRAGLQATGVVIRERETLNDGTALDGRGRDAGGARGSSTQRDVEYAVGRRVEQVVSQPGSIRRLQVVAVVRDAIDAGRQAKLEKLIAVAVGLVPDRGDVVVLQSMAEAQRVSDAAGSSSSRPGDELGAGVDSATATPAPWDMKDAGSRHLGWIALAILLLASLLLFSWMRRPGIERERAGHERPLSASERALALQRVREWMALPETER